MHVTLLMPCLNEIETIEFCINEAKTYLSEKQFDWEILIADNGSTDGSVDLARSLGARVIHVAEKGYGNALRAGIAAAKGKYTIFGDCDGSYDFSSLDEFIDKLESGVDLVMGNRFSGGIEKNAMPFLNKWLGNPVLSLIARLLFRLKINDFHCGIRGFRTSVREEVVFQTTGMEFATEMVVVISRMKGVEVEEVPTVLRKDLRSRPPHLRPWRDGWRHLRYMIAAEPTRGIFYPSLVLFCPVFILYLLLLTYSELILGSVELSTRSMFLAQTISVALLTLMFIGARLPPKIIQREWDRHFDAAFVIGGLMIGVAGFGLVVSSGYWISIGAPKENIQSVAALMSVSTFFLQLGISLFSVSIAMALTKFFGLSKNM